MKRLVIVCGIVFAAPIVQANCGAPNKTLFSCLTKNRKQVEVCNSGETIRYSFGKLRAKPEISFFVPRNTVIAEEQLDGGRYITHTIDIRNGNTNYIVGWSSDKLTESESGWVEVVANDKSVIVSCASIPTVGNSEGIEFKQPVISEQTRP